MRQNLGVSLLGGGWQSLGGAEGTRGSEIDELLNITPLSHVPLKAEIPHTTNLGQELRLTRQATIKFDLFHRPLFVQDRRVSLRSSF